MAKKIFSKADIKIISMDAQGRAYLAYNDKVGGEPFALADGCPYVEDLTAMYRECISKGITWQELLDVVGFTFDELQ